MTMKCSRCGKTFDSDQVFNVGIGDAPVYSCEGCLLPLEQDRFYNQYRVLPTIAAGRFQVAGPVFSVG